MGTNGQPQGKTQLYLEGQKGLYERSGQYED